MAVHFTRRETILVGKSCWHSLDTGTTPCSESKDRALSRAELGTQPCHCPAPKAGLGMMSSLQQLHQVPSRGLDCDPTGSLACSPTELLDRHTTCTSHHIPNHFPALAWPFPKTCQGTGRGRAFSATQNRVVPSSLQLPRAEGTQNAEGGSATHQR